MVCTRTVSFFPWEDELVQLDKRVAFEFPSFVVGYVIALV